MNTPRCIVVPVDFSAESSQALDFAIALAQAFDARIVVLHAVHVPIDVQLSGEWWAVLREQAEAGLRACQARLDAAGVKCATQLSDEDPVAAILKGVDQAEADLIVMGARGRSALQQVLLGSVAERTLRLAPCPVVTV